MVDITGLNKADVLAALYNASRPQGKGFLHYDSKPMERIEAEEILKKTSYFDYLKGRVMKLDLSDNRFFDEWGYDRDNGPGAAEVIVSSLRTSTSVNAPEIQASHAIGKADAAEEVMDRIYVGTTITHKDGVTIMKLGLSEVADQLIPAIDKATKP